METMYERIQRMTFEEMQQFVYWVYMNGNEDGADNFCDSPGFMSYFGGAMLLESASEVMPNDDTDDLWATFDKICGKGK